MRLYWILAAILILTYCVYTGVSMYTLPTAANRLGPEKILLSKPTQVGTNVDLTTNWVNPAGATLIFYILPLINDRTTVVGNEYATAINIGNKQSLQILIAPDAGRSEMMAPAILKIDINGQTNPDIVDIDMLKLQSWNCIAIVKQGRIFNIYVNGVLSVSHTCTAMPEYDNTQPIRVGDARLGGTMALISLAPYAMQVDDIQNLMRDTTDMDNKPYLSSDISSIPTFSLANFPNMVSFIMCPGGNCSSSNKMPPPMYQWTSMYS